MASDWVVAEPQPLDSQLDYQLEFARSGYEIHDAVTCLWRLVVSGISHPR